MRIDHTLDRKRQQKISLTADDEDLSLREAALKLGLLTGSSLIHTSP
jgi:hypothetical protein